MAERIVDVLEEVEVEAQDGKPLSALDVDERLGKTFTQQHAVRQVGQRIVPRHVRDLHLRPAPFGDVLVGRDPAAAGHRHVHDGDGTAVVELDELAGRRAGFDGRGEALEILVDVTRKASDCGAPFEQLAEREAGADVVLPKVVHLGVARIADDEAALAVEHDEPLRHVGNGRIEAHVLRVKVGLARAQLCGALGDQPLEVALDGADLLDHQGHRAVGPAAIAVECLVGAADETDEAIEVDRAGRGLCLGDLLGEQLVHRRSFGRRSSDLDGGRRQLAV